MKRNLKPKLVSLPREEIDRIFEEAQEQTDYIIALYRVCIPDLDHCRVVSGYPKVNDQTADYICRKAMEYDKAHHPDVMQGGMWLNYGFGSSPKSAKQPDWTIDVSGVVLETCAATPLQGVPA